LAGTTTAGPRPEHAQIRRNHVLFLLGAFALSRVVLLAVGVRFDTYPLYVFYQLVDPVLLRERLAESLFYLHSQPPLFNLGVGLVLKAFPEHYQVPFHLVYAVMGALLLLALYVLLVRVGLSSRASAIVSLVFSLSPAAILYENFLFYDYPLALLLTGAALALSLYVARPTFLRGFAFFGLAAAVVYTRSLYHVVWLLAVIALVVVLRGRGGRRRVVAASLAGLVLVVGLYAKNYVLFGVPGSSSWHGMNFVQTTVGILSPEELEQMIDAGQLSRFPLVGVFRPLERYGDLIEPEEPTGIPVLDRWHKSGGYINANNLAYIQVSDAFFRDDLSVIRHHPEAFLHGIARANRSYFSTPSKLDFLADNRGELGIYESAWNRIAYGTTRLGNGVGLFILAAYGAALVFGAVVTWRALKQGAWSAPDVTVAFCWLTILYTTVVANVAETTESFRYRWVIDPMALAILSSPLARRTYARAFGAFRRRHPEVRVAKT
jgi:hypothetical protein